MTHQSQLAPDQSKFSKGAKDGRHYWLTPPDLYARLNSVFAFDFDPCPYPKPDGFDGLTCEWGRSNYVNPPFGSVEHPTLGRPPRYKVGVTAWVRKAQAEVAKGKGVVMVYPIDKWLFMAMPEIINLGDVRWCATEDGAPGKGTGRHIALFAWGYQCQFSIKSLVAASLSR